MRATLRLTTALCALVLAGCTYSYRHAFDAEFSPALASGESEAVFEKTKEYFLSTGVNPVMLEKPNPNYFSFAIGGGRTGIVRSPFTDYVELQRMVESNRVIITLGRVISHPVDFGEEQVRKFVATTEEIFRKATGRNVTLTKADK